MRVNEGRVGLSTGLFPAFSHPDMREPLLLQRVGATPSPDYHKFSLMDEEKIMLVEKMCQLKKELVKQEEKAEFFEEHITQLTEDIQKKSR